MLAGYHASPVIKSIKIGFDQVLYKKVMRARNVLDFCENHTRFVQYPC